MGRFGFIEAMATVIEIRSTRAVAVRLKNGHMLYVKVPKDKEKLVEGLGPGSKVLVELATSDPTKGFLVSVLEKGGAGQ